MKKIVTIIIAAAVAMGFSATMNAARQNGVQVKGCVKDSKGEALGFATVALMTKDSTIVTGTAADIDGIYRMTAVEGEYIVKASLIGYKDCAMDVTLVSPVTEIPDLRLSEDSQMLEGAVVTERVKLVEMKMDKIVMNVSQSAFAQGNNGLDLIKKAPGVTIDKDGNIKLNGKSVSVWIDGRPSHLDGKSLEALLRSTNGESIEKFELMPNPSSKYDAEGQGGIINIKTKKNAISGFNGSMGINGGGMYFKKQDRFLWQESFWANLNYRKEKSNTFLNVYEGIYNMDMDFGSELKTPTSAGMLEQTTYSYLANHFANMNIKFGNDWFINDKNTFGFIVTVPGSMNRMGAAPGQEFNGSSTQMLDGIALNSSRSLTDNKGWDLQGSANINYTHIIDESRGAEITANVDYYRTQNKANNRIDTEETPVEGTPSWIYKGVQNSSVVNIYSAKLDYQTLVWKNAMLEAGGKWAVSMTDNNMTELNKMSGKDMNSRVSSFTYDEQVAAAYVSLAKPFTQKFTVKAGLRGEYTYSLGSWSEKGRQYFDVFPTLYLGYNHSENLMISFSYTRRIQRPSYYNLNPAEEFADAHSSIVGNPDLKPQYNNSIYGSLVFYKYFSVTLGYDHTRDMFSQNPSYKDNGDQILTWGNFGSSDIVFLANNISAFPITKWMLWTLNANVLYLSNVSAKGMNPSRSVSLMAYTDFTFMLPKDWKIQIDGRYNTPMTWAYFKMKSNWSTNFGIKKTMLDGKLSLSLDVDDIFRSSKMDIVINSDGTDVELSKLNQKYLSQKVKLGLTWNFGQAQQTRYRKVGNLDETSRLSGGGSGIGGGAGK